MSEQLRISAKVLGELALPSFCPRCFWLKMHAKRLPFQIFPGIFASIDSYSKKVTRGYFEHNQRLLKWFEDFGLYGQPVRVPHHSKFQSLDEEAQVLLTGAPDEILHMADGSYAILDYKTSKYTPNQGSLYPMYEVQLNAYAYIGERNDFSPVSRLVLVYYEPFTDIVDEQLEALIHEQGFDMMFFNKLVAVELKPTMVKPLMLQARRIYDQPQAPDGKPDCADCRSMGEIIELLSP